VKIGRMRRFPWLCLGLAILAPLFLPPGALARPGGGEGYSGGGDGGGGGDGDSGFLWLLIRLWIEFVIAYPQIGVPATIVIVVVIMARQRKRTRAGPQSWDAAPAHAATGPAPRRRSLDLDAIRRLDPDFSVVLFEDFVYALYARAYQAHANRRDLDALAPYLSAAARSQIEQRRPVGAPVHGVIVGAMRVIDLSLPQPAPAGSAPGQAVVVLEFESNMTVGMAGAEHTQYVRERWRLVRDAAVRTRPPEQVRTFHCPNCGAPFEAADEPGSDRCAYCSQVVSGGRFDWSVESIETLAIEERPPALTGTRPEVGTSWPTIFHPELPARRAELLRDDPAATDEALAARLRLIYDELNAAWTRLDLAGARPYVSDNLYDYLLYWTTAYRRQGLRNVLEGMRVMESTLVKVVRDRWYDSLTFRLWGAGRDYTVRQATGDVVAGNPQADRFYSEYWTLIRGAGVRGEPRTEKSCPNCGAPLDVNMAGECEHCGAKITRGQFDWVLSKIEQDDSYTG
jgi:predicted lipid-binding transport protein (Tim44 family)